MGDIIRKPNRIVTAKFKWTKEMLNVLYVVLEELENKQSKEMQLNLWGETEIKIPSNRISRDELSSYNVKAILKEFSRPNRWVEYEEVVDPNTGKIIEKSTVLISGMIHERYSKEITIVIPRLAIPVLLYLGDGYAKIEKAIAFSLSSIYSKRIYELCVKYRALGGFTIKIEELKEMFGIDNKYEKLSALKKYVLDVAQRELMEKSNLYFTYKTEKGPNKRNKKQEVVIFTIIDKNTINPINKNANYIYSMLCIAYPVISSDKAVNILNKILDHQEYKRIEYRFLKLREEFRNGEKTEKDLKTLLPYILKEDFNIE